MDSNEFNKIAGALIGSLLLFMLLGFFSGKIYDTRPSAAHHGDEVLAYALEIEDSGGEADVEVAVDYAALVASADTGAGEKVFGKCKSCHKLEDGANGVGPHLYDLVGRDIAAVDGYSFSDALAGTDGVWGLENLSAFLENPRAYVPGTKMVFNGLSKPEDRVNLIAYLNEIGGTPIELAAAPVETVTDATEETAAEATDEVTEAVEGAVEAIENAAEATGEPVEEAVKAVEDATEDTVAAVNEAVGAATGAGGLAALAASVSEADGKKVFRQCRACHKVEDGGKGVGPHLYGVVGRDIANVEGFNYSDALKGLDGAWTPEKLMAWLEDPRGFAPGNKMTFPGVKDEADRMAVIVFLNNADGSPEPIE